MSLAAESTTAMQTAADAGVATQAAPARAEVKETIDLSVIVVSYNTVGALEDCLASIRRTKGDLRLEVIVVDNASADGSAEMVERLFADVKLIRSPKNVGFAAGNNLALPHASGRHILLLNSDTIVHQRAFVLMLDFMEAHPETGAMGPRLLDPDGSLQPSVRRFPRARALLYQYTAFRLWRPWRKHYIEYKMRDFDYRQAAEVDVPMGAALLVRGDLLREYGGLDEGYFMYFEEADLCRRIRKGGRRIHFDPAAKISHKGGESSRPEKDFLFRIYLESMMRYVAVDLSRSRFRQFRWLFKIAFIVKVIGEIPIQAFYILKYSKLSPDPHRLQRKRAELRRVGRFFIHDLFWLVFKLGRSAA